MTTRNIYCRTCGSPLTAALYCNACGASTRDQPFAGIGTGRVGRPRTPARRGAIGSVVASIGLALRRRRRRRERTRTRKLAA